MTKLEWTPLMGRIQITPKGTARAHWYYYVVWEGAYHYRAGYYGFGREIDFTNKGAPLEFSTAAHARAFCEAKDASAVIIVSSEASA